MEHAKDIEAVEGVKRQAIKELIMGNISKEDVGIFISELVNLQEEQADISEEELAEAICNLIFDPLK